MLDIILDAVLDALTDSIVIIPILLLTYLLMEWLEHRAKEKSLDVIRMSGKLGPLFGGLVGIVPQCGFSGAAASFFAADSITLGTLIAIFMATSDEMLPILISEAMAPAIIIKILAIKCTVGIICGYLVDLVIKRKPKIEINHITDLCNQEKCDCDKNIFVSALKHTIEITIWIFIISAVINVIFSFTQGAGITPDNLIWNKPVIGNIICGLIGLIPNCSASVLITNLYVQGMMSLGTMMTGLFVNAGVGLLVLFRMNHHVRDNINITILLYILGVISGIIIGLL